MIDLQALGPNVLGDIQKPVARACEVMPEDIEHVSIVRLWHRANALRERLEDHDQAVKQQGAMALTEPNPAILAQAAVGPLRDFIKSYNVFIIGDRKGRELDRKSLGPGERERGEAAIAAFEPIIAALPSAPEVATSIVPEILAEQNAAARAASTGLAGDQDVALARDADENFVIALLRKAHRLATKEGAFAWKQARGGVYGGASMMAVTQIYSHWPAIVRFVVEYAETLKSFARFVYNNPSVPQMIDAIVHRLTH